MAGRKMGVLDVGVVKSGRSRSTKKSINWSLRAGEEAERWRAEKWEGPKLV